MQKSSKNSKKYFFYAPVPAKKRRISTLTSAFTFSRRFASKATGYACEWLDRRFGDQQG
jgi:hypothetical protein